MKLSAITVFLFLKSLLCVAGHQSDTALIRSHLIALTHTNGYRNHNHPEVLNKTADYIYSHFLQYADTVYFQEYFVKGQKFKNVIGSFGIKNSRKIIVGAHYDVCDNQQGADDNASGVVGLLELARLLKSQKLIYGVDLVAFSLEEPPYFRTEFMGSYVHAQSVSKQAANIYGMVALEMIGFFNDEKKSQSYPAGFLKIFYGNRGNFITLVKKFRAGQFAKQFTKHFQRSASLRTKRFTGPASLPGIDFSDHLNYWKFGISALMITDTAFYRNKNYHLPTDTVETLDIPRMAKVIDGVAAALVSLK